MKKLTEIYGLSEGPFDDINKQLAGATSAVSARGSDRRRVNDPNKDKNLKDVEWDLNRSTSVAREALGDGEYTLTLTKDEIDEIGDLVTQYGKSRAGGGNSNSLLVKINKALSAADGKPDSPFSSSKTASTGRSIGGLKLQ